MHVDDIPVRAQQLSSGMVTSHLDAGFEPQFPFGFGLSYGTFEYSDIQVENTRVPLGKPVRLSALVTNSGSRTATEVVQLYVRDLVGSVTRPVRELKGFDRVTLAPGESLRVQFQLSADDLAFYGRDMQRGTEPGDFRVWIGGDSNASLESGFTLTSGK